MAGAGASAFDVVPDQLSFPEVEEDVLRFWTEARAFETSLEQSAAEGRPEYTFYDGPPFATGLPHYGHILAGTIKDVVTRFAHMNGFHVSRRFGWDCHGLPVEYEIDKKLGIKSSEDVAKMGIRAYNAECRSIVTRYCGEWETIVKRLGRWIDFKNDYKTMEPWYMESVWWVFKTMFEKKLVYKGFRVMPYSFGCTTPLSNFEAGSNYKEVSDPAVVVTFPTVDEPEVSLLAWTTTPWTLPSNLALCVHPEMVYVQVRDVKSGARYILAEARLKQLYPKLDKLKDKYAKDSEFVEEKRFAGAALRGRRYAPLFGYFAAHPSAGAFFQVLCDTYVTDDSGTGVVHQAPAFGEDDYRVCSAARLIAPGQPLPCPVDDDGRFTKEVPDFAGLNVKEADEPICAALKKAGRLLQKSSLTHTYPFCWRSDTPLIYKAVPSWFVRLDVIKEQLLANNEQTYWVPASVKEKRFHNWLRDARDWNISRNRYWGTPIPIWASEDDEERVVVGSVAELERLSGVKVTDLHRENIDHITIPSQRGKGVLRRIPEVFDCWFESGAMPYAQMHYPFENKERFDKGFPADFIAEGLDQTRGWFYTLMVISTALFGKPAFKNLVVNGLVLAADGKKMSKRLKNYPDPMEVVRKYGADALRLYLINSPVVRAEPLKFQEDGVLGNLKDIFIPWFNAFRFLVQNVERDFPANGFDRAAAERRARESRDVLDRSILAQLHGLVKFVREEMAAYRLYTVVPRLVAFIDSLCNWYVRLNRPRIRGGEGLEPADTLAAQSTLFSVLLTLARLMGPFTPFFAEYQYRALHRPTSARDASVHFGRVPEYDPSLVDDQIANTFSLMQEVILLGRLARGNEHPVKRPLREMVVVHEDPALLARLVAVEPYIKLELNVQRVTYSSDEPTYCRLSAKLNGSAEREEGLTLGKVLGKKMGAVGQAVQKLTHAQLNKFQDDGVCEVEGERLTLADVFLNREPCVDAKAFAAQVSVRRKVTVVLDTYVDKALIAEQIARELVNRVQKLRKSSGVRVGDVLDVFYKVQLPETAAASASASAGASPGASPSAGPSAALLQDAKDVDEAVANNAAYVASVLRRQLMPQARRPAHFRVVGETLVEGLGETGQLAVTLSLAEPGVALLRTDEDLAHALGVDLKLAKGLAAAVCSMDPAWLRANATASLDVTVDGHILKLTKGKHYFFSLDEQP